MAEIGDVDVITMFDVIEHLRHPGEVLNLCGRHLRPGGAVILTTPDFTSLLARLSDRRWRNMTPPHHLWYFTPSSLARLAAAAAGLEVEQLTHPSKRVPAALVLQLVGRIAGVRWPERLMYMTSRVGVAVNLFDTMRVVLRKPLAPQ
jgi:2-polyprenyl-3-methyl-5-hydroxy-6-metoxy-1,4-benzoquinol methylase